MKPDATRHNPDPAYLRQLLGDRNPRATAATIGISERMLRYYLSTDPASPRAPYCVQYALEQLAREDAAARAALEAFKTLFLTVEAAGGEVTIKPWQLREALTNRDSLENFPNPGHGGRVLRARRGHP